MALIEIEKVKKTYQKKNSTVKVEALRGVDFSIREGEFTAIVGPSGSGKSTMLNLLGVLDSPTEGEVVLDGENIHGLSSAAQAKIRKEKIGFIFQAYNLIPVLSAAENISFALNLLNLSRDEIRHRTSESLEAVGLSAMADRRPSELSGGQQQRVAVARALAKKPKIVLADEPTANLDSHTGEEVLNLMKELNAQRKVTFIFSTHDPMVMDYAGRLITLHDGEVLSDKTK